MAVCWIMKIMALVLIY
ncbi:hypothetical protein MP638_002712 [Amoeboaphelidium occidentale]|nr:hypothetical protein MP638_002712 [Amoeboaphelidium occidentale]